MEKINNNKSDDSLNTFSPKGISKKRLGAAKKEMEGFHISQEEFDSIPTFEVTSSPTYRRWGLPTQEIL